MKAKQRARYGSKKEVIQQKPVPTNRDEKVGYFLQRVEDKVMGLLNTEQIKISSKKTPFPEPNHDETKNITFRLRQIQESKSKMEQRLRQVSEQQHELKYQQRTLNQSRLRSHSPLQSKVKSEFSQQDVSLLRKLKHQQRKFEKSLEAKTIQHEQRLRAIKREEQQLKQKHKKQETQARRAQIAQKLEQLKIQRAERDKKYQEQKKKIIELKTKKKAYEQLEKKQKQADRFELQNRVAAMQERLKQREVDLQAVRQHEQKYKELKAEQQAERKKRKGQLQEMAKQKKLHVQKSKYYTLVVNESKKRKEEQKYKERQRFQLVEAARSYAQNAMKEHAPRVKTKQDEQESHKLEKLTFQEQKSVGNSYFEFMRKMPKKKKDQMTQADSSQHTITPQPLRTLSTKYRDYLSQRRHVSDKMSRTKDSRIRQRGMMKEVEQACKLADSKQRQQGLERIKHLASRLEVNRGGEDHNMIDKINAKLKILQTLTK